MALWGHAGTLCGKILFQSREQANAGVHLFGAYIGRRGKILYTQRLLRIARCLQWKGSLAYNQGGIDRAQKTGAVGRWLGDTERGDAHEIRQLGSVLSFFTDTATTESRILDRPLRQIPRAHQ